MKIALLFPGYGSQYVGMGKELYDEYRTVQEYFEEASNCVNINFVKLCFASSDAEISKLINAYSSLFVLGCAVSALLKEHGIIPDVVTGYNNGETAALCTAGCFSFPDGLYLLTKMCSFFQEALDVMDVELIRVSAKKSSVWSSTRDLIEQFCHTISDDHGTVGIAINGLDECTVAGAGDKIKQLIDSLEGSRSDIEIEFVSPEIGLHSQMMDGVIDQVRMYLEKVDFKDITIPIISGIDGALVTQGTDLKERFIRHINEPLDFVSVMNRLADYEMLIVVTPAEKLGALLRKEYPEKTIVTISKKADIEAFKEVIQFDF